jgi:NADH dehydrogenase
MRVLLTGGTGFIGSRFRETLREQGHQVRLLVRRGSGHKVASPDSFEIVRGDIFDTNTCLRACDGVDAVAHLIGLIREFPAKGITFDEMHRVATKNILNAAKINGVNRFIHMSALGAKAEAASAYHRTKFAAEGLVRGSELQWTIFRPSWVFSPGEEVSAQIVSLVRKPVVPLIGGGKSLLQPVALEDVCNCMGRALSMPETQGQIYEMGGPDRISFGDIVAKTASSLGATVRRINVPTWALKPVVWSMQRFAFFPLTVDQLKMLSEDNVCEIDPYVKTFQVEPKSFVQALPSLVR